MSIIPNVVAFDGDEAKVPGQMIQVCMHLQANAEARVLADKDDEFSPWSGDYEPEDWMYLQRHEGDDWVLSSNFEDGTCILTLDNTGQWWVRSTQSYLGRGLENTHYTFEAALSDGDCWFTG